MDVRDTFTPASAPLTKTAASHGISSDDIAVYVLTSTSDSSNDSEWTLVDVAIDSGDFDVTITYLPTSTERVFILILDRSAAAGEYYVEDYSGANIVSGGGLIIGAIPTADHALANFNIIPKFYDLDTGIYTEYVQQGHRLQWSGAS